MMVLGVPFLLMGILAIALFSVYKKWYVVSGILMVLAVGINIHFKIFAVTIPGLSEDKGERIRVMTFNINGSSNKTPEQLERLAKMIVSQDADVVFLAEDDDEACVYLDSILPSVYRFTTYLEKVYYAGHFFYSKYPMMHERPLEEELGNYRFYSHMKIVVGKDTIALYGCHLASNNRPEEQSAFYPNEVNGFDSLKKYIKNIEQSSLDRCEEAKTIASHPALGKNAIVMGDFNDLCGSKALNILEDAGLKDAWWEGGIGYGATIHKPLPFRIDHIMYKGALQLHRVTKIDSEGLSDHDALVAEFYLNFSN